MTVLTIAELLVTELSVDVHLQNRYLRSAYTSAMNPKVGAGVTQIVTGRNKQQFFRKSGVTNTKNPVFCGLHAGHFRRSLAWHLTDFFRRSFIAAVRARKALERAQANFLLRFALASTSTQPKKKCG
jgi:hypothetical protein